jgi:hypothetical protein
VKFAGIEKYDLLRIQGLDKIPRYFNLAFEVDFPYISVANERISMLLGKWNICFIIFKIYQDRCTARNRG